MTRGNIKSTSSYNGNSQHTKGTGKHSYTTHAKGSNNDLIVDNAYLTRNTRARGTRVVDNGSNREPKKDVDTAHIKIVLSTTLNASIFNVCPSIHN